jgi:hypothetical protein
VERIRPTIVGITVAAAPLCTGCEASGAPWFPMFGTYFPAWMVCGLIGIAGAVGIRALLVALGLDAFLGLRLLTYTSMGVIFAATSWQVWFGP